MEHTEFLKSVNEYYTGKVLQHGATPQGVDWNGEESQQLRFKTLLQIINDPAKPALSTPNVSFTLLDYGCGYGSMYEFMQSRFQKFHYTGYDISDEMISQARKIFSTGNVYWNKQRDEALYDYIVGSGIFNVKLQNDETTWWDYVVKELDWINDHAVRGFAFNMLTSYSDKEFMRDYLFYADPVKVFDHCKRKYSKFVALLHDYPLYEFTILVRKS
jgi:SAM-dependent methyltransferase